MKTARKKGRNLPVYVIAIFVIGAALACNVANVTPGPTRGISSQSATPTQAAASRTMPPTRPSMPESNNQVECIAEILPGKTSRKGAVALLGEPVATEQEGDLEMLFYASPLIGQYDAISLRNQVVDRVSIVLGEDKPLLWSAVKAHYGEPAHTAFSNYLQGSRIFAFPEQGLDFIADDKLDVVFIQECFGSMSVENYMKAYRDFLLEDDPFTQ